MAFVTSWNNRRWFSSSKRNDFVVGRSSTDSQADLVGFRALFDSVGPAAFNVASAMAGSSAGAEQSVVGAFVEARRVAPTLGTTPDRRAILASLVNQCERHREPPQPGVAADDRWSCLPRDQRLALALVSLAGCDLDEVAAALALDRGTVGRTLRDALRNMQHHSYGRLMK